MSFETNLQFPTPVGKGTLTPRGINKESFAATLVDGYVGAVLPATPVLLVDTVSESFIVTPATLATDLSFGFIIASTIRGEFSDASGYNRFEIAIQGSVMVMEASAAIAVGDLLEFVPTGIKVATRTTGTVIAKALQQASQDGDLIKALILTPINEVNV